MPKSSQYHYVDTLHYNTAKTKARHNTSESSAPSPSHQIHSIPVDSPPPYSSLSSSSATPPSRSVDSGVDSGVPGYASSSSSGSNALSGMDDLIRGFQDLSTHFEKPDPEVEMVRRIVRGNQRRPLKEKALGFLFKNKEVKPPGQ